MRRKNLQGSDPLIRKLTEAVIKNPDPSGESSWFYDEARSHLYGLIVQCLSSNARPTASPVILAPEVK